MCIQEVLSAYGFKVAEIRNDRHMLAIEYQVDENLELVVTVLCCYSSKLSVLMI